MASYAVQKISAGRGFSVAADFGSCASGRGSTKATLPSLRQGVLSENNMDLMRVS